MTSFLITSPKVSLISYEDRYKIIKSQYEEISEERLHKIPNYNFLSHKNETENAFIARGKLYLGVTFHQFLRFIPNEKIVWHYTYEIRKKDTVHSITLTNFGRVLYIGHNLDLFEFRYWIPNCYILLLQLSLNMLTSSAKLSNVKNTKCMIYEYLVTIKNIMAEIHSSPGSSLRISGESGEFGESVGVISATNLVGTNLKDRDRGDSMKSKSQPNDTITVENYMAMPTHITNNVIAPSKVVSDVAGIITPSKVIANVVTTNNAIGAMVTNNTVAPSEMVPIATNNAMTPLSMTQHAITTNNAVDSTVEVNYRGLSNIDDIILSDNIMSSNSQYESNIMESRCNHQTPPCPQSPSEPLTKSPVEVECEIDKGQISMGIDGIFRRTYDRTITEMQMIREENQREKEETKRLRETIDKLQEENKELREDCFLLNRETKRMRKSIIHLIS